MIIMPAAAGPTPADILGKELCGCFNDCGECFYAYFCPLCSHASTWSTFMKKQGVEGVWCNKFCQFFYCNHTYVISHDRSVFQRKLYHNTPWADTQDRWINCCTIYHCSVCALVQHARAIKLWEPMTLTGINGPATQMMMMPNAPVVAQPVGPPPPSYSPSYIPQSY